MPKAKRQTSEYLQLYYCHNPNDNTAQHNLNTVVGLDMKLTVQTPPTHPTQHKLNGSLQEPRINTYWPQLNIIW